MTFLPIVDRELRVAARRHGTFTVRLAVGLGAMSICLALYAANLRAPPQTLAQRIFQGLSGLALFYCLMSGRLSTADCLSEEKREGTLGLLFLTDLRGHDVVLGKLAATSLNGFYALLAMFPVLALTLLLGGVTNGEFWRMVLVLVETCLFSLAIGLVASVLCRDARQAMGANFLLLLVVAGGLPACAGAFAYYSPSHLLIPQLLFPCPAYAFYASFDAQYLWNRANFWGSIGVIHLLTCLLVSFASVRVVKTWQDQPGQGARLSWRERWAKFLYGNTATRQRLRRCFLDINAFYWLSSRIRFKPAGTWAFLAFVGLWWMFVRFWLHFDWVEESFVLTTALMLNSILKVWIAVEAGQRLADDKKSGALELILCTSLGVRGILKGQWLALRRQFLRPLIVVMTLELLFLAGSRRLGPQESSQVLWFILAGLVMLTADILTWPWVAMSGALRAKSPNHAALGTIGRVLVLPWLVFCASVVTIGVWHAAAGQPSPDWPLYLHLWFWLGIATDFGFGLPAWYQLNTHFRGLAGNPLEKHGK